MDNVENLPKRGRGRPRKYDEETAKIVCARQKKEHYYNLRDKARKYEKLCEYLRRNELIHLLPQELF